MKKESSIQKKTLNKYIMGKIVVVIIIFVFMIGCTASIKDNCISDNCFKIIPNSDNINLFYEFEFLTLKNKLGDRFYLLIKKDSKTEPPSKKYQLIVPDKYYNVKLELWPPPVILKSNSPVNNIYSGNELIWKNDTLRVKVYTATNIWKNHIEIIK